VETVAETLQPRRNSEATTSAPGTMERRREHRYATHDPAEVKASPGPGLWIGVFLMDVSRSGIRLWLKTLIDVDSEVKIRLRSDTVISGKVRYCRPRGDGFDAGVLIQDVACPAKGLTPHISHEDLALYLVGKRLTVTKIVQLKSHLSCCEACRSRLAETNAALFAERKRNF
jgi:hypothetical protein